MRVGKSISGVRFNWSRTIIFGLVVFVVPLGFSAALSAALGWRPFMFGKTMEQIGEHFRWIDRTVKTGAVLALYIWFLRPLAASRVVHALMAFAVVEALEFVGGVAVTGTLSGDFVWQAFVSDLAIGLVAVGIATVISRLVPCYAPNRMRRDAAHAD